MPMIVARATMADALIDLNRQIRARYADDPHAAEFLTFHAGPVRHQGSGRRGFAILAYPSSGIRDQGDLMVSYWGDAPEPRSMK